MTPAARSTAPLGAVAGLGIALVIGWLALVVTTVSTSGDHAHGDAHRDLTFLVMWAAMSVAMMLPTVASLALAYAGLGRGRGVTYVLGYLAVWLATAPLAYALLTVLTERLWLIAAWLVAGLWQAAPWTRTALQQCRVSTGGDDPVGLSDAVVAGLKQGVWCCVACLPLMVAGMAVAMLLAPVAGIVVMVALTAVMIWEKSRARTAAPAKFARLLQLSAVAIAVLGVSLVAATTWSGPASQNQHHHQA